MDTSKDENVTASANAQINLTGGTTSADLKTGTVINKTNGQVAAMPEWSGNGEYFIGIEAPRSSAPWTTYIYAPDKSIDDIKTAADVPKLSIKKAVTKIAWSDFVELPNN